MVLLFNSQGMKNCKDTESFCYIILAIYTNDWFSFWNVYCCYVCFFSGKSLNGCKPRTSWYPLWQPGLTGLVFYGSGLACLPRSRLAPFHAIINFLANEMYQFSRLSHQTGYLFTWAACSIQSATYSASLDYEITLKILEFFSTWRKKWCLLFHFPQCVCFLSWTGQNPNFTAFTSKIQVCYGPEWTKGGTQANEFWQLSNPKMWLLNREGLKNRLKKWNR